jgi:hypothetical protein
LLLRLETGKPGFNSIREWNVSIRARDPARRRFDDILERAHAQIFSDTILRLATVGPVHSQAIIAAWLAANV